MVFSVCYLPNPQTIASRTTEEMLSLSLGDRFLQNSRVLREFFRIFSGIVKNIDRTDGTIRMCLCNSRDLSLEKIQKESEDTVFAHEHHGPRELYFDV
ncbi:hypothetical protein J6590_082758 [Homalodisca vitripennis]|nr:hypothetical protein J6590_082758 [Homalodisca vitripennis]